MKFVLTLVVLLIFSSVNAGVNGLTHHSRANCGNNESISWDWTQNWMTWVVSYHEIIGRGSVDCGLSSHWQFTWRNAMVHWGEGRGGWQVLGLHYMKNGRGDRVLVHEETVRDCSIYDGWWDKNK